MKYYPQPAISLRKLINKKFVTMKLTGSWKGLIGTPECAGSWIIFGDSGQGKTTFSLKLMRYLTDFKKCAYLPLEEGTKLTFKDAVQKANLLPVASKIKIWENYSVKDINEELIKSRAPSIVFIDSLQYLKMNRKSTNQLTNFQYKELLIRHPTTLFVFISHGKNGEPKGALAESIYFGSDVCLSVKDFVVEPNKSRYGGKHPLNMNDLNN